MSFAAALAAIGAFSGEARADFISWVGGNGAWGVDTNWNPVGQPGPLDPVLIAQGVFTATHDDANGNSVVAQMLLENRMTVLLSAGTISATGGDDPSQYFTSVGVFGKSHYMQTGGVLEAPLGVDISGQSTFELSGGAITSTGDTAGINIASQSAYLQAGGTNHLSLSIGGGTASITDGSLGDTTTSTVKVLFSGTLTQQGGVVTAHTVLVDTAGVYALGGGTVNANTIALGKLDESGAVLSSGTYAQTGGTVWVDNTLAIYGGQFAVAAGGTLNSSGMIRIGTESPGVPSDATLENGGTIVLNDTSAGVVGNGTFNHHGVIQKTGSIQIDVPISTTFVANGGTIDVQDGAVTITGSLSALAPVAGDALVKEGPGLLVLSGAQDWQAGASLRLLGGQTNVTTDLGAGAARPDVRLNAASLTFNTTQSLGALELAGASRVNVVAGTASTLMVGTLQLDADNGATLDLANNSLMLASTPQATVEAFVKRARNGGTWDGAGLTSSTAAAEATPRVRTLAVLSGSEYLALHGENATFNLYAVTPSDVLVKYTFYGDTDLNDVVDFDDYARIDGGFNNGLTGWLNGDFDYNGVIDFDDYSLIDLAFNSQAGTLPRAMAYLNGDDRSTSGMGSLSLRLVEEHLAQFGEGYAQQFLNSVPEPAAGFAGLLISAAMCRRRRR